MPKRDPYFTLIQRLNNNDPAERRRALILLRASQDPRSLGPTARRLFDSESDIRALAADCLLEHGFSSACKAIASLRDATTMDRGEAVAALAPLLEMSMPNPHVGVLLIVGAGVS